MNTVGKAVAVMVFMVAVMGYTVFNYLSGKIDMTMFAVCILIMGIPLFNIVNILIQQWKNKD